MSTETATNPIQDFIDQQKKSVTLQYRWSNGERHSIEVLFSFRPNNTYLAPLRLMVESGALQAINNGGFDEYRTGYILYPDALPIHSALAPLTKTYKAMGLEVRRSVFPEEVKYTVNKQGIVATSAMVLLSGGVAIHYQKINTQDTLSAWPSILFSAIVFITFLYDVFVENNSHAIVPLTENYWDTSPASSGRL